MLSLATANQQQCITGKRKRPSSAQNNTRPLHTHTHTHKQQISHRHLICGQSVMCVWFRYTLRYGEIFKIIVLVAIFFLVPTRKTAYNKLLALWGPKKKKIRFTCHLHVHDMSCHMHMSFTFHVISTWQCPMIDYQWVHMMACKSSQPLSISLVGWDGHSLG